MHLLNVNITVYILQFITAEQLAGSGVKAAPPEKTESECMFGYNFHIKNSHLVNSLHYVLFSATKTSQPVKRRKMTDEEIMAKLSMIICINNDKKLTVV